MSQNIRSISGTRRTYWYFYQHSGRPCSKHMLLWLRKCTPSFFYLLMYRPCRRPKQTPWTQRVKQLSAFFQWTINYLILINNYCLTDSIDLSEMSSILFHNTRGYFEHSMKMCQIRSKKLSNIWLIKKEVIFLASTLPIFYWYVLDFTTSMLAKKVFLNSRLVDCIFFLTYEYFKFLLDHW